MTKLFDSTLCLLILLSIAACVGAEEKTESEVELDPGSKAVFHSQPTVLVMIISYHISWMSTAAIRAEGWKDDRGMPVLLFNRSEDDGGKDELWELECDPESFPPKCFHCGRPGKLDGAQDRKKHPGTPNAACL